ncbi:MAG: hypothetical protein MJ188_10400 [Treponema sp.]|nr:hypothetical protein [Treponema sp.]
MVKKIAFSIFVISFSLFFASCFNEKQTPFYNSQWIMQNYDENANLYYHHLILKPKHKVMLRSSYADSTNIIVWRGTYKINSKKIIFNFEDCSRFENGENVGQYSDKRLVKFYNGEYLYSIGLIGDDEENQQYHLQLIRPKNQIYGETKDIYGNYFEEFVKIPHLDENQQ